MAAFKKGVGHFIEVKTIEKPHQGFDFWLDNTKLGWPFYRWWLYNKGWTVLALRALNKMIIVFNSSRPRHI